MYIYTYMYIMEYYSATKSNETGSFVMWINFESAIQSEVSQKEENVYPILTHTHMESRNMVFLNLFAGCE